VEYALSVLLFLLLVFGIAGFGHALYTYHFLNHAAKEAARYAAVRGLNCTDDGSCGASTTQTDIQTYVTNITPMGIKSANVVATATWPGPDSPPICSGPVSGTPAWASNHPGCTVQVKVQYAYNFIFPLIRNTTLNMSSTSEMIIAH
jgi:Flp pilus assembly protein TadG